MEERQTGQALTALTSQLRLYCVYRKGGKLKKYALCRLYVEEGEKRHSNGKDYISVEDIDQKFTVRGGDDASDEGVSSVRRKPGDRRDGLRRSVGGATIEKKKGGGWGGGSRRPSGIMNKRTLNKVQPGHARLWQGGKRDQPCPGILLPEKTLQVKRGELSGYRSKDERIRKGRSGGIEQLGRAFGSEKR